MNIIQGFPTPQKDYYKVYVNSITYNQAAYIEDNLNGVAMQETNFPFVHHVIDDASTDGEQEVIKTWMDKNCDMEHAEYYDNELCTITLVKNKKNPNCTLAAYLLKKNLWKEPEKKGSLIMPWQEVCPYEALCEGDDYWIDSKKLQKQVDILDSNKDCVLAYHAFKYLYQDEPDKESLVKHVLPEYKGADLFKGVQFQTATVVFRKEVLKSELYKKLVSMGFNFGDILLFLAASEMGRLLGIDEVMSVYRVQSQGISKTQLSNLDSRLKNLSNWMDVTQMVKKETAESMHKNVILRSVSGTFLKLVIPGHLSFRKWYGLFSKECYIYRMTPLFVFYFMFCIWIRIGGHRMKLFLKR